jgi:two-component system, chemotaxis family, chemotaxis protein CheY
MKREEFAVEPQIPARVLVMDDDECMRGLLRLHLANAGYEVLVAEDVIDAGHLLLEQRPDLILADIEMPFMDGLEFVEAVKADRATRSVPVIFLTGKVEAETQAKKLGAAAFLTKPLLVPELLAAVARQIKARVPDLRYPHESTSRAGLSLEIV